MPLISVTAERAVDAPAHRVYEVLRDYQQHHPRILPPAFSDLRVEEGGVGSGTVVSFKITTAGRTRLYRTRIAEPEPGRVLTESDLSSSLVTTFTVSPTSESSSDVRIQTQWPSASGLGGFFERLFAPRVLRGLYEDELARLERYAQTL